MIAMLLDRPGPVEREPLTAREVPAPRAGPGQVLVRVEACAICHTDLHTVEGELPLPRRPLVIGHQIVGRVVDAGPNAGRLTAGVRVGIPWLGWACGECPACRRGQENLCPRARFTGLDIDGGYAELAVADECFTHPLPDDQPATALAPLLCAGIIGFRALRRARVFPGCRVALFGFGASAHIALQVARSWECPVYVFTRAPAHQQVARELGAAWVGAPHDRPPVSVDAAVIFAPAGELVTDALAVLAPGGTVALAGIVMTPLPAIAYRSLAGERAVVSVANMTRADAAEFLPLAFRIGIRAEVEVFPLEEANRALPRRKKIAVRAAGVLVPGAAV